MSAYHHPSAKHARSLQARTMPAGAGAWASLALRACDATRVTTPAPLRDTKRCGTKREVDSMAEVNGS